MTNTIWIWLQGYYSRAQRGKRKRICAYVRTDIEHKCARWQQRTVEGLKRFQDRLRVATSAGKPPDGQVETVKSDGPKQLLESPMGNLHSLLISGATLSQHCCFISDAREAGQQAGALHAAGIREVLDFD